MQMNLEIRISTPHINKKEASKRLEKGHLSQTDSFNGLFR